MSDDGKSESPSGREGPDHGPTIDPVTRELRRTSVSQLQMADESTSEGCLRKWWYDRVMGRKEPSSEAQDDGKLHHGYMEKYLLTGEMRLPDRIVRNLHFVPKPGPDLLIEHPTIPVMSDNSSGLAYAPLRADGVPVVGYIDCVDGRCENPGGSDITDTRDPPGTIHVRDWKFTSSLDYAKTGPELVKTIQMAGYGKYRFDVGWPGELVRLTHGYFPKKGRGEARTVRVDRNAVERSWEHAESVVRSLRDVAREVDAEKVPANRRACNAFKKRCIHAANGYCTAGMHNSLRSIVGARVAQTLTQTEDSMGISLIDRLKKTGAQEPTPINTATGQPSVTVALTGVPAQAGPTPEQVAAAEAAAKAAKAAEVERLRVEEQQQREAKQFDAVVTRVLEHGMGIPALAGKALELWTRARPNTPAAPSGQLGAPGEDGVVFSIDDPAIMAQLLAELDAAAAARAEALKNTPPPIATPAPAAIAVNPLLPPESPIPVAAPAPAVVPTAPASATPPPAVETAPKKPRATAKKVDAAAAAGMATSVVSAIAAESRTLFDDTGRTGGINLVVDCTIEGINALSLHGIVDQWCDDLAKEYDAADIRCAPEKSPLGFGKWPGALYALARENGAQLAPGWYSIDSRGGQRFEVIIEALRPIIRASGGALIRGHR